VRAHGRRFYNFEGLDSFKAKFAPDKWEAVYALANERRFSVRSLYAIASAFTQGRPFRTVAHGLMQAVRQELRWVRS
jgi:phosphatidylglycerol lysyltransferase